MWDDRYAEEGFAYGSEPNDFLREHAHELSGRVLCLAEGEGRNAVYLAERGLEVVAVDASRVGLEKAERLAASRGVSIETQVADLGSLEIPKASFDGIVSIWCHVPTAIRRPLHRAVVDALRPGGVFLLEAYTPNQIPLGTGGPKDTDLLMTPEALRDELDGLMFDVLREIERDVLEGRYHTGKSAVVRVLAKKI